MSDGILFILCGPSGVGKSTLAAHLMELHPNLRFSVSYTTRAPRGSERDGVEYHFRTIAEFEAMKARGELAESALVHGNYYGTAVATIEDAWARGENVIFDIDYQGALQLREKFGERAIVVLVLPPSMDELEDRLRARATDAPDVIERRLRVAREEIAELEKFADHTLINADRAAALDAIAQIYSAHQL